MPVELARNTLVVGIGDCRIARSPVASLATYALGSCIAVMAWDWKLKMGGLLHVMLPESSLDQARAASSPHVYADTGVPALLRKLCESGSSKKQLRWCLAGGASMMADSSLFEIGKRNQLAVKRVLWQLGVFIDQEDLGGKESRSVRLELETGKVDLRKGISKEQILMPAVINFAKRNSDDANIGS
jgi:chemotaxis protein CheD